MGVLGILLPYFRAFVVEFGFYKQYGKKVPRKHFKGIQVDLGLNWGPPGG